MNDYPNPTPNYGYGQQPGPYGVPPTPPRPPKRKHTGAKIFSALACVAVLTVGGCLAVVGNTAQEFAGDLPNTVPDTTQPSGDATPGAKKPSPSLLPRDGVLRVPSQVKPGTYETTVPTKRGMERLPTCYIARLAGTSGELSDVISNQNRYAGEMVTLTVKASDAAVEIRGCGTWKRVK